MHCESPDDNRWSWKLKSEQRVLETQKQQQPKELRSRLKCVSCAAAIPVGIVVVRGDCDLETCRLYIDRLQEASSHHQDPPPHPAAWLPASSPHTHHHFMTPAAPAPPPFAIPQCYL